MEQLLGQRGGRLQRLLRPLCQDLQRHPVPPPEAHPPSEHHRLCLEK